jgi:hypothetical protein
MSEDLIHTELSEWSSGDFPIRVIREIRGFLATDEEFSPLRLCAFA